MAKKVYRISEIAKIKSGKRLPKDADFSIDETDYKYIRGRDIKSGKINTSELKCIEKEIKDKISRYIIRSGDIALTIVANIGDVGYCEDSCDNYNLTENAVRLTEFDISKVNSRYLCYYLSQKSLKNYMENVAAGAAQSKLGIYKIEKLKIELPSVNIQEKIADFILNYDQLIDNNNKRIKLLEQMAEEIYKNMFAYHRIKDNSKIVKLGDIITIQRGISYSSKEIDCIDGNNLINLKNINSYGGFRRDGTKKYNGKYKTEQVVRNGELVMGVTDMTQDRRTVGSVALVPNIDGISVISADLIKISSDISNTFLFAMFKYGNLSRYISQFANGANVLHLKPQSIQNIKVQLPKKELIDKYVSLVNPLIEETDILNIQNDNLVMQRDLLLPRLMSGKLEIKED